MTVSNQHERLPSMSTDNCPAENNMDALMDHKMSVNDTGDYGLSSSINICGSVGTTPGVPLVQTNEADHKM